MSLGWALRGYIGGGPLGAMIPGAMVGLALCLLLRRETDAALVAAFAAVGIGFGGEMTYGQTVGLSLRPETYWWAITGFAVKGGVWGMLGGAVMGIALLRDRLPPVEVGTGLALLVGGTWLGWKAVNEPKLIYFSNRLDRPRPEVWAGLLCGALVLLAWLMWRGRARVPAWFALCGGISGGLGFAAGAAVQVWGRSTFGEFPLGWWKVMELTFGAVFGMGLGWCAWRDRAELAGQTGAVPARDSLVSACAGAAVAMASGLLLESALHTRFNCDCGIAAVGAGVLLAARPLANRRHTHLLRLHARPDARQTTNPRRACLDVRGSGHGGCDGVHHPASADAGGVPVDYLGGGGRVAA